VHDDALLRLVLDTPVTATIALDPDTCCRKARPKPPCAPPVPAWPPSTR
jgi:hypothetical protein